MKALVFAAIPLAMIGCKRTDKHAGQSSEKAAKPSPVAPKEVRPQQSTAPTPDEVVDPATITWSTHTIDDLGVEIPQIDQLRLLELPMGGARSWQQHKKPIATAIWAGSGRTLEAWRDRVTKTKGAKLGKPTTVTVCGVQGTRQEVSLEAYLTPVGTLPAGKEQLEAIAGPEAMGNKPARPRSEFKEIDGKRYWELPARTTVALGFEHKGTPMVATWTVEGNNREAFAPAEKHFFDSIRCK